MILFQIANTLVKPSYISLETALSYYRLIPEESFTIISVSTLKTNHYETPMGNFMYQSVKPSLFFGYRTIPSKYRSVLMAEPEKALLDLLYLRPELNDEENMEALRWNLSGYGVMDEKMDIYLQLFNNHSLNKRVVIFKKVYHAAIV